MYRPVHFEFALSFTKYLHKSILRHLELCFGWMALLLRGNLRQRQHLL
jgi:hypothetical protein